MQISIVIPYHNREKRIEKTLLSVVAQSHRPLEVILVNNNSTDNSEKLCHEFKSKHETKDFIIILANETKRGANAARNRGLEIATSEYISFFDSDDEMLPRRMELINKTIVDNFYPDIIGSISRVTDETRGGSYIKMRCYSSDPITQITRGQLSTSSMTIRSSILRGVGGWDERLDRWQDWNLGVRLLQKGYKVKWIKNIPLDVIYAHEDSITGLHFGVDGNPLLKAVLLTHESLYKNSKGYDNRLKLGIIYRLYLLAALIEREGNLNMSSETISMAKELSKEFPIFDLIFYTLNRYTLHGGRAAWRVAKLVIHLFG
ncbi:MAG: glycosyltransferase family 2 protein [Bacteroidales bacterium]